MLKAIFLLFMVLPFIEGAESEPVLEDYNSIIQLCIDIENLNEVYLLRELQEDPLYVLENENLPAEVSASKFGKPVVFASKAKLFYLKKLDDYMEFDSITISENRATVTFHYLARFRAKRKFELELNKRKGQWMVSKVQALE